MVILVISLPKTDPKIILIGRTVKSKQMIRRKATKTEVL